jgi:hypothetical protein
MDTLDKFLPHYLTYDLGLDTTMEEWDFPIMFGLLNYHFEFKNLFYDQPNLDFKDTKVDFETGMFGSSMKVKFPGIKNWNIGGDVHVNTWILPADSMMHFNI